MGTYQGQKEGVARIIPWLKRLGLDCSFSAVGATRDEFRQTLLSMETFVQKERQLLPGVFHFYGSVTPERVEELLDVVDAAFPSAPTPKL